MGKIVRAILRPINTSGTVILGTYMMLWGFWLFNPAWDVFSRAPLYDIMGQLAPEWAWGVGSFANGAVMVLAGVTGKHRILMYSAMASAWQWAAVAMFYFIADWQNTGGVTSLMICVYAAFVYLNVKINYVYGVDEFIDKEIQNNV